MRLESQDNGTYVAQWVPAVSGNYLVQVYIDGRSTGIHTHHYICMPHLIALNTCGIWVFGNVKDFVTISNALPFRVSCQCSYFYPYSAYLALTGQEKPIEVLEPELPPDDTEDETEADEVMVEEQPPVSEEKTEPTPLVKMKLFSGKTAAGLRIRRAPSLTVSVVFTRS